MRISRLLIYLSLWSFLLNRVLFAQEYWSFLNTSRIGASQFIEKHPQYDGRGVVIFILDGGVDMGVNGLLSSPDSSIKIIDVQDFSGEGDVFLEKAKSGTENNEAYLESADGKRVYGYDKIDEAAADSVFFLGFFNESDFKNSDVNDFNCNGRFDDSYAVVLFQGKGRQWKACVDLDGDGNLHDEKCLNDYNVDHKIFDFRGGNPKYDTPPLNFALKIYPNEKKVNFHFDLGGHGTHVAGIAAGYKINGQQTLNGIAPGAQIISLKIGDDRLSGGSTLTGSMKKAFDFVAGYIKHNDAPVVINMSYGIGSEDEGSAAMEYYLNDLLDNHPSLVVCVSAGNEGPGISTIGMPAAAENVITVGALNVENSARDVYGATAIQGDKIFSFSSRGGEEFKPDVVAPGAASSTVPPFSTQDVKWGTSMASPQAAGVCALLLSAMHKEFPNKKIDAWLVKKALKNSAKALAGYSFVDQGSGVIDIAAAYDLLKKYVPKEKVVLGYQVNTINFADENENGSAGFWRTGSYFPTKKEPQKIYINAKFKNGSMDKEKKEFYRAFNIRSSSKWLKVIQKSVYLKGTSPAALDVYADGEQLKKPGLYSSEISGFLKGGIFASDSPENKEFGILYSVIVPYLFSPQNHYRLENKKVKLNAGEMKRFFVDVPVDASCMAISLVTDDKNTHLRTSIFDPKGKEYKSSMTLDATYSREAVLNVDDQSLSAGVWEIDAEAPFTNKFTATANMSIYFGGLDISEKTIRHISVKNGQSPYGSFTVLNQFSDVYRARISGRIMGISRLFTIHSSDDHYEYTFSVGDEFRSVEFDLSIDNNSFERITDFSVNIKDFTGKVLKKEALNYKTGTIDFIPPASGSYTIELLPAFVNNENMDWQAEIKESYMYFRQTALVNQYEKFYPQVRKQVYFSVDGNLAVAPENYYLFGDIWIDDINDNGLRTTIPIELDTTIY